MKRLLIVVLLSLLAVGQAAAIERYDMSKMSCDEVQAALQSERKTILRSPSSKVQGMMKFDRYVVDRQACGGPPNWAQPSRVRTGDGQSCVVYRCISVTRSTPRY